MKDWTTGEHVFRTPHESCSRSPCPALNALANHNIIPYSGKDITFGETYNAVRSVYDLSVPMAAFVTFGGYALCGHRFGTRLNLSDLAKHNKIEHNASLAHQDAKDSEEWAKCPVDPELLKKLITEGQQQGQESGITFQDLLSARLRRLSEMPTDRKPPLSFFHKQMLTGETALILCTLGDTGDDKGKVDRETLRIWFGEERLPNGWTGAVSGKGLNIGTTNGIAKKFKAGIEAVDGKNWDAKQLAKKND